MLLQYFYIDAQLIVLVGLFEYPHERQPKTDRPMSNSPYSLFTLFDPPSLADHDVRRTNSCGMGGGGGEAGGNSENVPNKHLITHSTSFFGHFPPVVKSEELNHSCILQSYLLPPCPPPPPTPPPPSFYLTSSLLLFPPPSPPPLTPQATPSSLS